MTDITSYAVPFARSHYFSFAMADVLPSSGRDGHLFHVNERAAFGAGQLDVTVAVYGTTYAGAEPRSGARVQAIVDDENDCEFAERAYSAVLFRSGASDAEMEDLEDAAVETFNSLVEVIAGASGRLTLFNLDALFREAGLMLD